MNNAVVVEVLQGQDGFCKVHPCHFYRQWAHVLEQVGTISTWRTHKTIKVKNQIELKVKEMICHMQLEDMLLSVGCS